MPRVGGFVALVMASLSFACQNPPPGSPTPEGRLVIVNGSFNTTANNSGSGAQGINIDVAGGRDVLPLSKIKRYTVTIHTALLSTAPAGVDMIELFVGVLSGTTAMSVRVVRQDPAAASPFPHPGFTVLPYTGTNSHIRVTRGADGLGTVPIHFTAYVEVEP